jgi:predicted amidohydrolase YtcJ
LSRPPAELLITGRIATLAGAAGFGWVEAIAIRHGRVLAAGPASEVEAACAPSTRRWRLPPDQAAMPGITDAHIHLMTMARSRDEVDLSAAVNLDDCLMALAEAHQRRVADGDSAGWLFGHGWHPARIGGWPDADILQRVAPGRPVVLWAHDHHSRWVSHAVLTMAGIGDKTADPDGGLIRRNDEGRATGILHETAAALVNGAIPEPDPVRLEQGLLEVAAELVALGVVGCHDPGELDTQEGMGRGQRLYRRLAGEGRLPLRVHASIRDHELEAAIESGMRSGDGVAADAALDLPAALRAERYVMGWLKLFSDGSLGSRSAALLEPYSDGEERQPTGGPAGMLLHSPDELADLLRRAAEADIAGQIHAIGDAAVRLALDLLAAVPRLSLQARIEHAQLVHPDDVPRFGALGVAASVQPVHLRTDAPIARTAWGSRAEHSFPLAGLLAGGALIPFGTDAPVEPIDPWPGIAVAVCRRDPLAPADAPLGADQAIDLARAMRAACLDPAQVAGETDRGRLIAGSRADLLVVPAEALSEEAAPAALAATRPLATLIDGEVAYRSAAFSD